MNTNVLEALRRALGNPDRLERQNALARIGDFAPRGAVDWVIPLLSDEDVHVRIDALLCLRELRDDAAVPYLINILGSARGEEQEYAILALRGFTATSVKSALLAALADPSLSNTGRLHAVMQLWRYPDDDAIDSLKGTVLNDLDQNVRSHAADSLLFLFRTLGEPPEWRSFWEEARRDAELGVS